MKTLPIVLVTWYDAEHNSTWEYVDAKSPCPRVYSTGFLVSKSEGLTGQVVLVTTHSETHVNGTMRIPAGTVISIEEIKPGGADVPVYDE